MAYTITDIAELVRYHLVLAEPDDERADANLAQLVPQIERNVETAFVVAGSVVGLLRSVGCSVDTDLIHPDGHHCG